jgi:hypothetical protein
MICTFELSVLSYNNHPALCNLHFPENALRDLILTYDELSLNIITRILMSPNAERMWETSS